MLAECMKYRTVGGGAFSVSRIGVGGNIFGHFCSRAETARILAVAADLGINLVDTADAYSNGKSEEYIGAALRGSRDKWVIATKAGLTSGADPSGFASASSLRQKIEGSLARLNTDYVDLYQVHHFDPKTPIEETIGTLALLRAEGKIRSFGVSNYSGTALRTAIVAANGQGTNLVSVQCHYNLFSRSVERDLFPVCRAHGIVVLAYGVLARGVLTGKYARDCPPPAGSRAETSASVQRDLAPDVLDAVARIVELAKSLGLNAGQVAVAWLLQREEVASALVGVRHGLQLRQIADAVKVHLDEPHIQQLDAIAKRVSQSADAGFGAPRVFG